MLPAAMVKIWILVMKAEQLQQCHLLLVDVKQHWGPLELMWNAFFQSEIICKKFDAGAPDNQIASDFSKGCIINLLTCEDTLELEKVIPSFFN